MKPHCAWIAAILKVWLKIGVLILKLICSKEALDDGNNAAESRVMGAFQRTVLIPLSCCRRAAVMPKAITVHRPMLLAELFVLLEAP
ncbi:MAG: hypothetical protein ACK4FZ_07185 [Vogesella sp.]|uniref:hypothetical protein n=1 Tax=Vogesella sp. TaxID=1904252 RepID=UPI00391B4892